MDKDIQSYSPVWFAVVGDNGFGYVSSEVDIVEAVRKLRQLVVVQLPNQESARNYAYSAYAGRWFMRNAWAAVSIKLPANLPPDYIFLDPEFEKREGGKTLPFFPALLQ